MEKNYPKNAGIIPDGNRRWATQNRVPLDIAYWYAMQKLEEAISTLFDLQVNAVCVYLLSKDNVTRKRSDLDAVLDAEISFLDYLLPNIINKYNTNVYHAGNKALLSKEYIRGLDKVCKLGNGFESTSPRLYLCAGYDPLEEIKSVTPELYKSRDNVIEQLWVPLELDMVIRTGGDIRISGFLPLQSRYAEFFFEEYFFPDITKKRINQIMVTFAQRSRRFGI